MRHNSTYPDVGISRGSAAARSGVRAGQARPAPGRSVVWSPRSRRVPRRGPGLPSTRRRSDEPAGRGWHTTGRTPHGRRPAPCAAGPRPRHGPVGAVTWLADWWGWVVRSVGRAGPCAGAPFRIGGVPGHGLTAVPGDARGVRVGGRATAEDGVRERWCPMGRSVHVGGYWLALSPAVAVAAPAATGRRVSVALTPVRVPSRPRQIGR